MLEILIARAPPPSLSCPVGFVGAMESKDALCVYHSYDLSRLNGRLGGILIQSRDVNAI